MQGLVANLSLSYDNIPGGGSALTGSGGMTLAIIVLATALGITHIVISLKNSDDIPMLKKALPSIGFILSVIMLVFSGLKVFLFLNATAFTSIANLQSVNAAA